MEFIQIIGKSEAFSWMQKIQVDRISKDDS